MGSETLFFSEIRLAILFFAERCSLFDEFLHFFGKLNRFLTPAADYLFRLLKILRK